MAKDNEELNAKIIERSNVGHAPSLKEYGVTWFKQNGNALKGLMGSEAEAKRLFLTGLYVASKNDKLLQCDPSSFFSALLRCAELKLYPGPLQEAAIVPFFNSRKQRYEAEFMPQYQGLIKLSMNSGFVKSIVAHPIHQNDVFEFEYGSNSFLKHRPLLNGRGPMIAVYAYAVLKNESSIFIVMSEEEVHKLRARSKMWHSDQKNKTTISIWSQPDLEHWMWRKSAIKQLCKILPKSADLAAAMEADDEVESGEAKTTVIDLIGGVELETSGETNGKSEDSRMTR